MKITSASPDGEKAPETARPSQHLQRKLTERQLSMIAIGGAIGVGLFLGSNVTISLAGPAVILTYLLGAVLALIMAYVLAEMAVVHPVAGSFRIFPERYLNRWSGLTLPPPYRPIPNIALGAQVTAMILIK